MEMGSFRPELHVAQQSRRDKLRGPQTSGAPPQHLQDFPDHFEHPRLNPDLVQVRNVNNANLLYDPAAYSEMVRQQIDNPSPFPNWSLPVSSSPIEPQNCGNWKGSQSQSQSQSQQSFDWVVNYASGDSNVFGEVSNISAYPQYLKPGYNGLKNNQSGTEDRVQLKHFTTSSPLYQNSLQDAFTSASMVDHQQNMRGGNNNNHKLALLPPYANQPSDVLCFDSCHQWSGGDQLGDSSNPQGLSLSLSSSNPALKLPVAQFGSEDLHSKTTKSSIVSKLPIVGISGNSTTYRNTGPLGPFTGYATILKASKFLKPAQLLLDEFCGISGSKVVKTCEVNERTSAEVSTTSGDGFNAAESSEVVAIGNSPGGSSSTFYTNCNEMSCEGGVGSSSSDSFRPEFQQKKAKLIYMQEEVG
jgi:hypothetical protein